MKIALLCGLFVVLAIGSVSRAQEGTGFYTFSISASSTDPQVNSTPTPEAGLQFLYLWSVDACNQQAPTPGWSAAVR